MEQKYMRKKKRIEINGCKNVSKYSLNFFAICL